MNNLLFIHKIKLRICKSNIKKLIIVLFCLLSSIYTFGQITIHGTITNKDKKPLPFLNVILYQKGENRILTFSTTDDNGNTD